MLSCLSARLKYLAKLPLLTSIHRSSWISHT